jgi:hypothetical protein
MWRPRRKKISNAQATTDSALKAMNEGGPWGPYRLAAERLAEEARKRAAERAERERRAEAEWKFPWEREAAEHRREEMRSPGGRTSTQEK